LQLVNICPIANSTFWLDFSLNWLLENLFNPFGFQISSLDEDLFSEITSCFHQLNIRRMALLKKRRGKRLTVPANEPELSCGGEQPPQGSSLRGRSDQMR
jgi:hypothetical protein